MAEKNLYRISFHSQGKIYEIYARNVSDGGLFGFVQIEELVFGERGGLVVDPSEERIKDEFADVKRTYLPMHSILRVDEVARPGISKISDAGSGNVTPFPLPSYPPGNGNK